MHPLMVVFFSTISTAHSVLFHFLMTVQAVSLTELTRVLLVTPRHKKDGFPQVPVNVFFSQCGVGALIWPKKIIRTKTRCRKRIK